MVLRYIDWKTTNPIENLAIEAYLTETVKDDEIILYLWQNANTVVIGRHQNAWQECHMQQLHKDKATLVRRLSGGGAVYHDLGNLNYTFMTSDKHYDVQRQLSVIMKAVQCFDIEAVFSGRNDLLAEGKKFSGNAFYKTLNKRYHHGTLLVDVDQEKMSRYLNVRLSKFQGKGVRSVKSRVVNLKALNERITIVDLKKALVHAFEEIYGMKAKAIDKQELDGEAIRIKMNRFGSDEWIMGKSYKGVYQAQHRFIWGEVLCHWEYDKKGETIKECVIYSDAMDQQWIQDIMIGLKGMRVHDSAIYQYVSKVPSGIEILDSPQAQSNSMELAQWLQETMQAHK